MNERISKITVDDVRKVDNPALKSALMSAITRRSDVSAAHQNHGSHGDSSTAPSHLRVDFVKGAIISPKT